LARTQFGRAVRTRPESGQRASDLRIAFLAVLIPFRLSVRSLGGLAGYFGGLARRVVMRLPFYISFAFRST